MGDVTRGYVQAMVQVRRKRCWALWQIKAGDQLGPELTDNSQAQLARTTAANGR